MAGYRLCVVLVALLLVTVGARDSFAQAPGYVGVGFSFVNFDGSAPGFTVKVAKDVNADGPAGLGPVGDFSLHHDNGATLMMFTGGIRVTGRPVASRVRPFGQFLVGRGLLCGNGCGSAAAFVFGGGVHLPVGERLNVLAQFDLAKFYDTNGMAKRTTIGLSIPFGGD